jgi:hypothetical protein
MRIIIELEGDGSGEPEIVLRSASSGQRTMGDVTGRSPGASGGGGIDAGPAPTGDSGAQTLATAVTPSASVSDAAGGHSAGAAPTADTGG